MSAGFGVRPQGRSVRPWRRGEHQSDPMSALVQSLQDTEPRSFLGRENDIQAKSSAHGRHSVASGARYAIIMSSPLQHEFLWALSPTRLEHARPEGRCQLVGWCRLGSAAIESTMCYFVLFCEFPRR